MTVAMDPRLPQANSRFPIKVVRGRATDRQYCRGDTCIVYQVNAISCEPYGIVKDLHECYPHEGVIASRRPLTFVARAIKEHRDVPGEIIIQPPSMEEDYGEDAREELPTLVAVVSQFGWGPAFEGTEAAVCKLEMSKDGHYVEGMKKDTEDCRLQYFKQCMKKLLNFVLGCDTLKQVIIPAGLGRRGRPDNVWKLAYLPSIQALATRLSAVGKSVTLLEFDPITNK